MKKLIFLFSFILIAGTTFGQNQKAQSKLKEVNPTQKVKTQFSKKTHPIKLYSSTKVVQSSLPAVNRVSNSSATSSVIQMDPISLVQRKRALMNELDRCISNGDKAGYAKAKTELIKLQ